MDPIEKARAAWRELWIIRAEGSDPKILRRQLAMMEVNDLAALDCLEALRGPRMGCLTCGEGRGECHCPEMGYDAEWGDLHAEAWDKFTEAVCGGK